MDKETLQMIEELSVEVETQPTDYFEDRLENACGRCFCLTMEAQ